MGDAASAGAAELLALPAPGRKSGRILGSSWERVGPAWQMAATTTNQRNLFFDQ
jgi:hypothetical protein